MSPESIAIVGLICSLIQALDIAARHVATLFKKIFFLMTGSVTIPRPVVMEALPVLSEELVANNLVPHGTSSCSSQALADLHSRSTVLTEKPSISAISSMVKPPKYLNLTT